MHFEFSWAGTGASWVMVWCVNVVPLLTLVAAGRFVSMFGIPDITINMGYFKFFCDLSWRRSLSLMSLFDALDHWTMKAAYQRYV